MRSNCVRPGRALALIVLLISAPLGAQTPAQQTPAPAKVQAPAEKPAEQLPPARQIIDRYIAAIGGRAAMQAQSSSHATGTISLPSAGMTGTVEVFAAKPNKALIKMTLAGLGDVQEGFDGTIGWSMSAMTGPTVLQGKELEQKRFDADFFSELHADDRYESLTTVEKAPFEGRPCYKVRLVRKGGGEDFEFYDVETGLKAGSIATRDTAMGTFTGTTVESDYKRFGKLMQATTIKQTVMGLQQVITISSIEYDNVDPSVFEPPAAIKAIVK
jgi:zinc protease